MRIKYYNTFLKTNQLVGSKRGSSLSSGAAGAASLRFSSRSCSFLMRSSMCRVWFVILLVIISRHCCLCLKPGDGRGQWNSLYQYSVCLFVGLYQRWGIDVIIGKQVAVLLFTRIGKQKIQITVWPRVLLCLVWRSVPRVLIRLVSCKQT